MENRLVGAWRALYDRSAAKQSWEQAHRWSYSEQVAQKTIDDIRDKLNAGSAECILEVGCGSGTVCHALLGNGQKGIGIDLSENLLGRASSFGVDRRKVALIAAEASRLPICDSSADRVLCYSVFQSFPSKKYAKRVLNELIRVCQPGGVILVGDIFQRPDDGLTRKLGRIVLNGLRALRLRIWLWLRPFSRCTTEEELSNHYVLRRRYSQRFFMKALQGNDCNIELMSQQIASRAIHNVHNRFDVRIVKTSERRMK
jgi:ubiquinone/menaquinone biosynthesis C-methylase UbiE